MSKTKNELLKELADIHRAGSFTADELADPEKMRIFTAECAAWQLGGSTDQERDAAQGRRIAGLQAEAVNARD